MSSINYKNALARIVAQMRDAGYSIPEIIALVIGDTTPKAAAPAIAATERPRMIAVEHANGTTRLVPWSPEFQAQLDREVKAKAQPTPAPKPVAPPHEIVFAQSRGITTHDAQVASYQEAWTPTDTDVDLDALIAEQEADLAKMKALRGSK